MFKDSRSGYGLVTIVLHWVTALLIIFLFGLGLYMVDLDYYDPWYHRGPALHISFGLLLLLLMLMRIIWRLINPQPAPLPTYSRTTHLLASGMKYLLYLCIFVAIISGYLVTSADGKPPTMFGLIDFPIIMRLGPDGVDQAGLIHELLAWAIVSLSLLHAAAALRHHFMIGDRTLMRILKPIRKSPTR